MASNTTFRDTLRSFFYNFINWLSFSEEIHNIVDSLNQKLEEPPIKLGKRHISHPGGFGREFGRRRLTIAQAYLIIARHINPEYYENRLQALRVLIEQSLHAKTVNMPINTARVQIHLMKDAVKAYGHRRKQMEHVADFGRASFGQEAVIRSYLKDLGLIEVPELGKPLSELDLGWDDHVHDSLSEGRKTPTQVLLDAFVKGMSRVTIVYNNIEEQRMIHEVLTAGEILGITVEIGIEFSIGKGGTRRHYMYVPPTFTRSKDFFNFLDKHKDELAELREGLRVNQENRYKSLVSVIKQFNEVHLPKLNEDFTPDSPCWFPEITEEEFKKAVACGQASREHLSELLREKFSSIFHKRVLLYKTMLSAARDRFKRGVFSQWEMDAIVSKYESTRHFYETLSRSELANKYLATRSVVDYDSIFDTELPILEKIARLPGRIVMIHPLELGLKKAIKHVIEFSGYITNVETMNLRDSASRNPSDIIIFNKFIFTLNNRSIEEIIAFLEQNDITGISREKIERAKAAAEQRGIIPNIGSDSTGRNKLIPGMGFIRTSRLCPSIKKEFMEKHVVLPQPIATLYLNCGKWTQALQSKNDAEQDTIVCMGKQMPATANKVGDEPELEIVETRNILRYINPEIKNFARLTVGFVVALYWMYMIQFDGDILMGTIFASIWFFITFFRNVLVDLVASSGTDFRNWSLKNVNFDNAYTSVFWTGFSVPVLGIVKNQFDIFWPGVKSGMFFEGSKFFFICIANGLYISGHNKLRNFDKSVIRGNFFRSILSWPVATVFSPIGNMLGVPSIVQAKFWSDVVAGIIEGSNKFSNRFTLRKRDLTEILPKLHSEDREERITAMLDTLYIWARAPRGKTCLRLLLLNKPSLGERIWKRTKETPEETEARARKFRLYYQRLLELFGNAGMLNILTDFALKNFDGKDAVELTALIGEEAEDFLYWLKDLGKQFPEPIVA
ncbi:MAG: hypothetical protein Kow0029_21160 [Candidatus Rifleibacteriota bacterium]